MSKTRKMPKLLQAALSMLLVLCLLVSMCACGSDDEGSKDDDKSSTSSTDSTASADTGSGDASNASSDESSDAGNSSSDISDDSADDNTSDDEASADDPEAVILDAPEKLIDQEQGICAELVVEDETGDIQMTYAVKDYADYSVIYIDMTTEGEKVEMVIESSEEDFAVYVKSEDDDSFILDAEGEMTLVVLPYIFMACSLGFGYEDIFEDVKFAKLDDETLDIGDAYVYALVEDGETTNEIIWVDKATGVWVKVEVEGESTGINVLSVTTNFDIPEYK